MDRNPNGHTGEKSGCIIRVENITVKYVCVYTVILYIMYVTEILPNFLKVLLEYLISAIIYKKKSETYPELSQEDFEQQQDCCSKITIMKQPAKLAE